MAHTDRCGNSTNPLERCRCTCGGTLHGGSAGVGRPASVGDAAGGANAASEYLTRYLRSAAAPNSPAMDAVRTQLFRAKQAESAQEPLGQPQPGLRGEAFAKALAQAQSPDGGFTIDPRTGRSMATGFFVSAHPELEQAVAVDQLTIADLDDFILANRTVLGQQGNYFGAWHDPETGIISLDVSTRTENAEHARAIAATNQQVAYFDAQTFDSVLVDADQRQRINEATRSTND